MIVTQLKALQDNFIYLIRDEKTSTTVAVDPSISEPVLNALNAKGWKLNFILTTHHHWDHVGGNLEIKKATGCNVVGFDGDAARIPGIDIKLKEGEIFKVGELSAKVLFIPGHTLGHIAYYFEKEKALFCGDTLFSLGCGRLFEGTAEQMFASLALLKKLPDDVKVFCGHEYTVSNAKFGAHLFKDKPEFRENLKAVEARFKKEGTTVPSLLGYEKNFNPFLMAEDVKEFARYRLMKDDF